MKTYKLKRIAHGFRNQEIWLPGHLIREWWEVPETDTIWLTVSRERIDRQQIECRRYRGVLCGVTEFGYVSFQIGSDSLGNIRHALKLKKSDSIFMGLRYVDE